MEGGTLHPGDEVGGYVVVRALGVGGSGRVFLVRDEGGALAALKLVDGEADPLARERLRREVEALMAVRHPAVPEVIDAELDGPATFVVFEYVRGLSLADHVAQYGPVVGEELAQLAQRTADALEAAHAAGVIHRDVTPSNIMMAPQGAVLIDFGLSHREDDARLTKEGLVSGTAGYVAPEVIDGEQPGPGADRWSWAATIVYAMTGKAPFGTGPSAIRKTLGGRWRPPALPGADALAAALGAAPNERPGMRDVVAALRGATVRLEHGTGDGGWNPEGEAGDEYPDGDGAWDDSDLADDPDALVLPASSTHGGQWRDSTPRPFQMAAWHLCGAMIAGLVPIIGAALVLVAAVVARSVYRRQFALGVARARRGYRRRDDVVHTVGIPFHVVRALIEQLPAAILAVVVGGGIGALWWLLVSWGAVAGSSQSTQDLGHAGAVIAGTLAGQAVLWWGPWQWETREGAYRILEWLAPTRGVSAAWTMVALTAAGVVIAVVMLGAGMWWWPATVAPGG